MLELTTRFSAITTGVGSRRDGSRVLARSWVDPDTAAEKATAHVRYIDRPQAVGERAVAGVYDPATGIAMKTPDQVRAAMRARAKDVALRGGASGARILEKGIVSLPNSWPHEARQAACDRLAQHLAPEESEAMALVVTHRDKAQNNHLHFAAIDGKESLTSARLRRPHAKRVRRQNVLRMSEGGRPKRLRTEVAEILNEIADEGGLERVEWRSFVTRGVAAKPGHHDGPTARAVAKKIAIQEAAVWLDAESCMEPIDQALGLEEQNLTPSRPKAMPSPPLPEPKLLRKRKSRSRKRNRNRPR